MNDIYVIGCGGVGSWLAPSLCLLAGPNRIILVDGDRLEEKNLNRQLFNREDIGATKAQALALRYHCQYRDEYYSPGIIEHSMTDWLICVVDNHIARKDVLAACDTYGCQAIFAANETHSAEAYYYHVEFRGTKVDPRVYYPEILTDVSNNPLAARSGCTGEAQVQNRQLVSANFMAAALAQQLYVVWGMEFPTLEASIKPRLPFKLVSNLTKLETHRIGDVCPPSTPGHSSTAIIPATHTP